ncbi:MAG: hypothetical protein KJO98_05950, partial [Rhodothermia bacterium]|nr:hypothetical protein [Rhodothermia bacterium]
SIVSSSDQWLFISSNGALTAGRRNPEHALFPYYTVDKIHDSQGITGGRTAFLVESGDRTHLWEPFRYACDGLHDLRRNLYKNKGGNKLVFEEVNSDLGLRFRTLWTTCDRFGFVRKSSLEKTTGAARSARVLDGIQNLLPYGTDRLLQTIRSNLLDAYKKNELLQESGLGLFLLSSIPVDRPEPSEALKATTVWSVGLDEPQYLLSSRQVDRFRRGESLDDEIDVRAERGAYFVSAELDLSGGEKHEWYVVADVDQGPAEVAALRKALQRPRELRDALVNDIAEGTDRLVQIVAAADGLQMSADEVSVVRHFSNVLFNVMRGGIFADGYRVGTDDLISFIGRHNREVRAAQRTFLDDLTSPIELKELLAAAHANGDPDLVRLCYEYLPLTFSRRHGDPSRPWNDFSIDVKDENGVRTLNYEGNWRDIFQNWEALLISFPEFTAGIISKFVNASTPDGYNPYRITSGGIDWEEEDPDDPWSFIGYWGDHQIVYLLKLLEISERYHPDELERMLTADDFVYANVPYRIRDYQSLLQDPHSTIDFDGQLARVIGDRVAEVGADGRLVWDGEGSIHRANLLEKILVSVLTKYSNFIPEAGIWMNTQRPEWNDANNALVGYGVSMVTLCYLRRFQSFLGGLIKSVGWDEVHVGASLAEFLADVTNALESSRSLVGNQIGDQDRKRVLDALGEAGSRYRKAVYRGMNSERRSLGRDDILKFIDLSLEWTDHSIQSNRRSDGLYHAYNLMRVEADGISVARLYEMLEGQVAVLSSGLLSPEDSCEVLKALEQSALFREDQYSYLLYPDRELPRFVEKNIVPDDAVHGSTLLSKLVAGGDTSVLTRDEDGQYHFNGAFRNRYDLNDALDRLPNSGWSREEVDNGRQGVLDVFERVFDHRSYTGRSGTFFGYEGLGCIYWHMVSKLVLAVGETYVRSLQEGSDPTTVGQLKEYYYSTRAGIGLNKDPGLYGAFPTDAYSHTPAHAGAKQPGMTGQVKEDILCRWIELGVRVEDGCVSFDPALLRPSEIAAETLTFVYVDPSGAWRELEIQSGEMAFTYCQVPVVYRAGARSRIRISGDGGGVVEEEGLRLPMDLSQEIFSRSGAVVTLEVEFGPEHWPGD